MNPRFSVRFNGSAWEVVDDVLNQVVASFSEKEPAERDSLRRNLAASRAEVDAARRLMVEAAKDYKAKCDEVEALKAAIGTCVPTILRRYLKVCDESDRETVQNVLNRVNAAMDPTTEPPQ